MRRTLLAGVVAAVVVSAAGCGADEPRPRIAEPTATATESPSASPSPDTNPGTELEQPPAIPSESLEPTTDGAVAFTSYFWAEASYAQRTGDVDRLRGLVAPSCSACQAAIKAVVQANRGARVVTGGEVRVVRARAETFSPSDGVSGAAVEFRTRNERQEVSKNGEVIQIFAADEVRSRFLMTFVDNGWRIDIWKIVDQ